MNHAREIVDAIRSILHQPMLREMRSAESLTVANLDTYLNRLIHFRNQVSRKHDRLEIRVGNSEY